MKTKINPLILIILDGWGISPRRKGNAVLLAKTPNIDRLKKNYSYTELEASGVEVGLAKGMIGGSEVGHLNIGAGKVVIQNVLRINKTIQDGSFFKNPAFLKAVKNVKKNDSTLHLMGLLSDAGVHSHEKHLYALLKLAQQQKLKKVMIHVFTDGRDTPIKSAEKYIKRLNKEIRKYKTGKIATVTGRYYAMNRDNRWDRTKKAYFGLTEAKGVKAKTALVGIKQAYKKGETDEFIQPIIIDDFQGIKEKDSAVFFNYRSDRPRQLVMAFIEKRFKGFKRKRKDLTFVCMIKYYDKILTPIAIPQLKVKKTLGEVLSEKKLCQLRISETEKYAQVTYFLNGMIEKPFKGEDRILIPSPKVPTYDLKPEMSAFKTTKAVLKAIKLDKYEVIIMNFPNSDMVGHTGNLKAAIASIEVVDKCLGEIVKLIKAKKGIALITADHGNAEEMIDLKTNKPLSAHTTNPVPFILVAEKKYVLRKGSLSNITPTILELLNIKKPKEMTAKSLVVKMINPK